MSRVEAPSESLKGVTDNKINTWFKKFLEIISGIEIKLLEMRVPPLARLWSLWIMVYSEASIVPGFPYFPAQTMTETSCLILPAVNKWAGKRWKGMGSRKNPGPILKRSWPKQLSKLTKGSSTEKNIFLPPSLQLERKALWVYRWKQTLLLCNHKNCYGRPSCKPLPSLPLVMLQIP